MICSLTNAPVREEDLVEDLETKIMSSLDQGFIVGISSMVTAEMVGKRSPQGILLKHSYSIVSYRLVTHEGFKLVLEEVVNPYGSSSWEGPWCASSPFWQDIGKKAPVLKPGHFWIFTQDLKQFFHKIQICEVRDDYHHFAGGLLNKVIENP